MNNKTDTLVNKNKDTKIPFHQTSLTQDLKKKKTENDKDKNCEKIKSQNSKRIAPSLSTFIPQQNYLNDLNNQKTGISINPNVSNQINNNLGFYHNYQSNQFYNNISNLNFNSNYPMINSVNNFSQYPYYNNQPVQNTNNYNVINQQIPIKPIENPYLLYNNNNYLFSNPTTIYNPQIVNNNIYSGQFYVNNPNIIQNQNPTNLRVESANQIPQNNVKGDYTNKFNIQKVANINQDEKFLNSKQPINQISNNNNFDMNNFYKCPIENIKSYCNQNNLISSHNQQNNLSNLSNKDTIFLKSINLQQKKNPSNTKKINENLFSRDNNDKEKLNTEEDISVILQQYLDDLED